MGRIGTTGWIGLGILTMVVSSGCRTVTRLADVPRADLELEGSGNRGYLMGVLPPAPKLKSTRQMVQMGVEIPSFYEPKSSGAPAVSLEDASSASFEAWGAAAPSENRGLEGSYDSYVVQKGDSLWSIAAKPEVYGKASRWQRIFDANRDILKNPNHLRAGMTLKIPRQDTDRVAQTEQMPFKK